MAGLSLAISQQALAAETKETVSAAASARTQPAQEETAKFCQKLKPEGTLHHTRGVGCMGASLMCMKQALLKSGAIESLPTVGAAKNMASFYTSSGNWVDLLQQNPKILESGELPVGSILVLDRENEPGCPVSRHTGQVATVCGYRDLIWQDRTTTTMSLQDFLKDHPKCVKNVLLLKKWQLNAPKDRMTPKS